MAPFCSICLRKNGSHGYYNHALQPTKEALFDHLESVHHVPIVRPGETPDQVTERFIREHPEARTCPECKARGEPWTR